MSARTRNAAGASRHAARPDERIRCRRAAEPGNATLNSHAAVDTTATRVSSTISDLVQMPTVAGLTHKEPIQIGQRDY